MFQSIRKSTMVDTIGGQSVRQLLTAGGQTRTSISISAAAAAGASASVNAGSSLSDTNKITPVRTTSLSNVSGQRINSGLVSSSSSSGLFSRSASGLVINRQVPGTSASLETSEIAQRLQGIYYYTTICFFNVSLLF